MPILNSTMNSTEDSSESIPIFNVVICVFNIPLSLVSMVANAVILVAISKTSALHSPSTILLSNLALTDLSVGLLAQPLYILNALVEGKANFNSFYGISSKIYNVMGYCLCGTSFFTVSAIGIDRLVALEYHLRYQTLVTPKKTSLLAGAIWLFSGFISSMWLWSKAIFYPGITVIIALCLITSFIVYFKVYRIIRRHQVQIHSQMEHFSASYGENHRRFARLRRSALNTFYVYCLFLLCYLPYLSILITGLVTDDGLSKGYAVTTTVVFLNSALNPVLYCWRISEVRRAVKQILRLQDATVEPRS